MKHVSEFFALLRSGAIKTPAQFFEALKNERAGLNFGDTSAERFLGTVDIPEGRFRAPARLSEPSRHYFTQEHYLRLGERADWQHVDVKMLRFAASFIEAMRKRQIPIYCHSAFRGRDIQNRLVEKGRSKTPYPKSAHNQGKAVDLVHARYHWNLDRQEWDYMGTVGKEIARRLGIKVVWGGDWRFYDPAHWELADYRENIQVLPEGEPKRMTPRKILRTLSK